MVLVPSSQAKMIGLGPDAMKAVLPDLTRPHIKLWSSSWIELTGWIRVSICASRLIRAEFGLFRLFATSQSSVFGVGTLAILTAADEVTVLA